MPRRISGARIKANRTHSVEELAEASGVTQQTVRTWIERGLPVLSSKRPALILGSDAKDFLASRIADRRCNLDFGEVYCLRCRAARALEPGLVDYRPIHEHRGRIEGICQVCGCLCGRLIGASQLPEYVAAFDFVTGPFRQA